MKTIEQEVKHNIPLNVYKEKVSEQQPNQPHIPPRNLIRVQNIKAKQSQHNWKSRDAISNAHELAYNAPGFVRFIATYPDLIVIMGQRTCQKNLAKYSSWNQNPNYFHITQPSVWVTFMFHHCYSDMWHLLITPYYISWCHDTWKEFHWAPWDFLQRNS